MVKIATIFYVMIIFLSLFFVATNVNGKLFFSILNFLTYYIMLSHYNSFLFYYFFTIATNPKCVTAADCPKYFCGPTESRMCVFGFCLCGW